MKTILAILAAVSALSAGHVFASADDGVKATFGRFVAAQNAHDVSAIRELLLDPPNFLWVTRGEPIRGREASLRRFETRYRGTWKLSPDIANLKVVMLSDTTAQLFVPIMFDIGPPVQPARGAPILMNQTLVKTSAGWRIASILPTPLTPPAPTPAK